MAYSGGGGGGNEIDRWREAIVGLAAIITTSTPG